MPEIVDALQSMNEQFLKQVPSLPTQLKMHMLPLQSVFSPQGHLEPSTTISPLSAGQHPLFFKHPSSISALMRPQSIISQSLILPRCAGSGRADNSDNMLDRMARHVNVNNEIGLENREQRMSVRHDPQSKNSNLDVFSSMIIKPSSESRQQTDTLQRYQHYQGDVKENNYNLSINVQLFSNNPKDHSKRYFRRATDCTRVEFMKRQQNGTASKTRVAFNSSFTQSSHSVRTHPRDKRDKDMRLKQPLGVVSPEQTLPNCEEAKMAERNFKKKTIPEFLQKRLSPPVMERQITIDQFEMMEKIGKGAFGDVFLSQEKVTGLLCVVKKVLKRRIKEQKLEEHLLREIKIQSYLRHKHIASLYCFFSDKDYIYLVVQLLSDGSLAKKCMRSTKVPEGEAADLLRQICFGLRHMHMEQIIHRDIKPENIFLHNGYVKIGDFGCSVFSSSQRKTIVGCLAYISPQQLKQQYYDDKIDVWSVGILTYEMLTGKAPFESQIVKISKQEIAPRFSVLKFPPEVSLSPSARDFITKLLHEDPLHRMDIEQALEHPFLHAPSPVKPYQEKTSIDSSLC